MLLNAPLRQESQNRCPQTDTWTAFRTGRWQIRHNKFSLTAGTKKARYPGMFCNESSAVWPKTTVGLMSTPAKLPALETTALCDWTARSFFVVWINFACRRLTGHAQNNSVTTNVTGRGSLFAWQDIWDNKASLVHFRLRFNLSSSQIKCVWDLSQRTFLRSKSLNCLRTVQMDFSIVLQVAYASKYDYQSV